jgi:hypothetical protein
LRGSILNSRTLPISRSRRWSAARMRPPLRPWISRNSGRFASSASLSACSARASASSTVSPCKSSVFGAPWGSASRPDVSGRLAEGESARDRLRVLLMTETLLFSTTSARPRMSMTSRALRSSRTTPLPNRVCTESPTLKQDAIAQTCYCRRDPVAGQHRPPAIPSWGIKVNEGRLAEREGFEPPCPLRGKTLSRRPRYDHFGTSPQRKSARRTHHCS